MASNGEQWRAYGEHVAWRAMASNGEHWRAMASNGEQSSPKAGRVQPETGPRSGTLTTIDFGQCSSAPANSYRYPSMLYVFGQQITKSSRFRIGVLDLTHVTYQSALLRRNRVHFVENRRPRTQFAHSQGLTVGGSYLD